MATRENYRYSGAAAWAIALSTLQIAIGAHADPDAGADNFSYFIAGNALYDNNLFRLSPRSDVHSAVNSNASREDFITQASLGGDMRSFFGRQSIAVEARIDDNRYAHNNEFDNVSGAGKLLWDWVLGDFSSGSLGAAYERRLSRFADSEFFGKDTITGKDYFFDFKEKISPHWRIAGGVLATDVDHGAAERIADNVVTRRWHGGLVFESLGKSSAGLEYAHALTHYPDDHPGSPSNRDYRDNSLGAWWKYEFSVKTRVELQSGYLRRKYEDGDSGNFSGDISRLKLVWNPLGSLAFDIDAWRELHAFREADAEYFVATGISLAPEWALSEKVRLIGEVSREHRDYKNIDNAPADAPQRSDNFLAAQLTAKYQQTRFVTWSLSFRRERRLSNQEFAHYDDSTSLLSVKFMY